MRIFALETDKEKIKQRFCHGGECIVLMTYFHGLSFLFAIFREIIITTILLVFFIVAIILQWPLGWIAAIIGVVWFIFVFFNVVRAYIDWNYDFIVVTTDKIIVVDQTSFFHQEIKPIHIENVGGVTTNTQFWGLFPFGAMTIHLKEGMGGDDLTKKYVPRVDDVAAKISDVVTQYQRRTHRPVPSPGHPQPQQQAPQQQ
jgi:hypothetical protein